MLNNACNTRGVNTCFTLPPVEYIVQMLYIQPLYRLLTWLLLGQCPKNTQSFIVGVCGSWRPDALEHLHRGH